MNCPNCGAGMALIESRRYFQCGYCSTYHFPETVEADGIRIVGRRPDALECPVCTVGMTHALLDDDQPIDFCVTCRGVLLPRPTFAIVTTKRRAWATNPPSEPVPLDRQQLHRKLACPKCGGRFDTYPHLGPGAVVIDNCAKCDLIWMDFGEMRQIVAAPGKDRGTRHVPRIDQDFIRNGQPVTHDHEGRYATDAADPLGFLIDVLFSD